MNCACLCVCVCVWGCLWYNGSVLFSGVWPSVNCLKCFCCLLNLLVCLLFKLLLDFSILCICVCSQKANFCIDDIDK